MDALYAAANRLETLFPGRSFTLTATRRQRWRSNRRVRLDLVRASSHAHDAIAADAVEIKFIGKKVAMRHEPPHLIVLQRLKVGPVRVIYNGPGDMFDKSGTIVFNKWQRSIQLATVAALDRDRWRYAFACAARSASLRAL